MAQPTQQLPSWLSASAFTVTSDGVVETGASTVFLPLTYFGPSIPLGTNSIWVFGGSTSPVSTATATPSATPSSSSSSSSVTSISSSSSSSTTSVTSTSPSGTTPTSSAFGTVTAVPSTPSAHSRLTRGAKIAVAVVGAFLLVCLLLVCALCFLRWRSRRRGHRTFEPSDMVVVDSEGHARMAGQGEARPTGGEEDSFLRSAGTSEMTQVQPLRVVHAPVAQRATEAAQLSSGSTAVASDTKRSMSPFFRASGTSIFFDPNRAPDPAAALAELTQDDSSTEPSSGGSQHGSTRRGPILTQTQVRQMEEEWNRQGAQASTTELGERADGTRTPLRPPPLTAPESARATPRPQLNEPRPISPQSDAIGSDGDVEEQAALLTARRVTMTEATPPVLSRNPPSHPTSWRSSFGLVGLSRLSRLSWFQRMEHINSERDRRGPTRSSWPRTRDLSDAELHAGRATLAAAGTANSDRPISYMSAASSTGNSLYYDAQSSLSTRGDTPSNNIPPVPPLPHPPAVFAIGSPPISPTQAEAHSTPIRRPGSFAQRSLHNRPSFQEDILDQPAPSAVSPFSTASSRGGPAFPPGLEPLPSPQSWRESSSDMPSAASLGTRGSFGVNNQSTTDVLEQGPPPARQGWTELRSIPGSSGSEHRTTVSQPTLVDTVEHVRSEQGSLHSHRSHLSVHNPSGMNSRSPSRNDRQAPSYGTVSSNSSGGSNRSMAISQASERRGRVGELAAPSQFGRASLSAMGRHGSPPVTPAVDATFTSSMTGGTTTSGITDISADSHETHPVVDPQTGHVMHFPTVPRTTLPDIVD